MTGTVFATPTITTTTQGEVLGQEEEVEVEVEVILIGVANINMVISGETGKQVGDMLGGMMIIMEEIVNTTIGLPSKF